MPLGGQLRRSLRVRSLKFFHGLPQVSSSAARFTSMRDENWYRMSALPLRRGGTLVPAVIGLLRPSAAGSAFVNEEFGAASAEAK
jgi:hypothetical protein